MIYRQLYLQRQGYIMRVFLVMLLLDICIVSDDKLVIGLCTSAVSAMGWQRPKAKQSTLYCYSVTVNAGNGVLLHCMQMDQSAIAFFFFFKQKTAYEITR